MTERILGPTGSRRRRRSLLVPALLMLAAGLVFGVTAAVASHPEVSLVGSNFEIDTDANLTRDDPAPSIDWASVTEVRRQDTISGPTDESFGQGAKEDTAEPTVVDGSIPPNKSDLKFFGIYQEGGSSAGFLNMFWSRVQEPSGSTNMDFEFNKRQCTPNASPADADCSSNGLTPLRSVDDLLVIYDLGQGGTVPTLSIREWTGSEWGEATDLSVSNKATGSINTSAISAANADGLGAQSARTFGEAQLAMSEVFPAGSGCLSFGSAYLKSRSSDAFNAALKDFVPPVAVNLTNCGTINIHKQDDALNNLGGAAFTLYTDNAPLGGAAPHGAEDIATAITCTTAAATGNCSMTNVPFGQYWVVETTTPTGYTTAADQNVVLSGGNATLSLTFTDNRQPASVKVKKVDDDSPANPLAGAVFKLYTDNSPLGPPDGAGSNQDQHGAEDIATSLTCTTGDGTGGTTLGECTISNILTPGNYWVVETTTPAGYDTAPDQYVTIALGDAKDLTSTPFVNQRKFRMIVIVCQEDNASTTSDTLYPSAVTIDGTSLGNSISSSQATGAGLTDAELCGITQARKSGLHHGTHKADPVSIPQ
jgi:hypothetical protein